jgi:hypothetical protein
MTSIAEYAVAKIASSLGGLFGGAGMMSFIRPKTIGDAFIRGGVSTGSALIFADPAVAMLGIAGGWESQLMAGAVIGFVAYSVLGAIANFFRKTENADIFEMVEAAKGKKPKPKAKPRRTTKRVAR